MAKRHAARRHELKTRHHGFQAVLDGLKLYEVRKDDRDFQIGDELFLREWDPTYRNNTGRYTGREVIVVVTYITRAGTFGIPKGLCVLGIRTFNK